MIISLGRGNRTLRRVYTLGRYFEGFNFYNYFITEKNGSVYIVGYHKGFSDERPKKMSFFAPIPIAIKVGFVETHLEPNEPTVTKGVEIKRDGTVIFTPGSYESHIKTVLQNFKNEIIKEMYSQGHPYASVGKMFYKWEKKPIVI